MPERPRRRSVPIVAVLVVAAASAIGCTRESPPPPPGAPPSPDPGTASLLLVTLDTFRADAAGCGGSPGGRTPHLDRLARTGIQFETGIASCPLTLPSHATMLTGLEPPGHGIRSNGVARLPGDVATLGGELKKHGFVTGAFLGAFALVERFGLGRGFDEYDDDVGGFEDVGAFEMARRRGDRVVAAAESWSGGRTPGARRFEWIHLFDAHQPYDAPKARFAASGRVPYLADVAETDGYLGMALRSRALAGEDTWVIVLGDHGESIGDHREETHGLFIYESTTRVPAVVWPAPAGRRPGRARAIFRPDDLPATVFDLLGLDPAEAPGEGRSALAGDPGPAYLETLYPRLHHGWSDLRAVRQGKWKYIAAPRPELYDLESDPGERVNLHDDEPAVVAGLAAELARFTAAERTGEAVELDAGAREALASLGYVTDTVESDRAGVLPDPKDMVRVNELLMAAMRVWGDGRGEAASNLLAQALAIDPKNREIHKTYGMLHAAAGRHDLAVSWYKRCLELPPFDDDHFPRGELARSYLQIGQPGKALEQLEIVVRNEPEDASSWNNLGVARMGTGDRDGAREAWKRALELDPALEAARTSLARTGPAGADR